MASERSAQWHDGAQLDLADEMSSLTLEFVGRTLFGTDVRDEVAIVAARPSTCSRTSPR